MYKYPIKILRVITWLPWGGIEKRMVEVLKRLDRDKFLPLVCCLRSKEGVYEKELEKEGIKVVKLNFRSRLDPGGLRNLSKLMKAEKVDVVHSHMYRANIPSLIAAKLAGVPVKIVQVHNIEDWKKKREWAAERIFYRWADKIVGVSRAVLDYERKFVKFPKDKTFVLYNGINLEEFEEYEADKKLKLSLGIPERAKVVGLVARLHPDKGQDIILEVARDIKERVGEVFFMFIGSGGYGEALREKAGEKGIDDFVVFTGAVKDIKPYYSIMDVSVLPSRIEGFSNVILESFASGIPVIATRTGGNPEIIEEGENGFLVDYGDRERLKEKIIKLLQDDDLREGMGKNARKKVEKFSLQRMVEETERLYEGLWYNRQGSREVKKKVSEQPVNGNSQLTP